MSIFATSARATSLVHHPYDSFSTSVQRFIEQAAADPAGAGHQADLYCTSGASGDSPIVNALIDAAEAGKQVVALVELKARFDEQANIRWARKLEQGRAMRRGPRRTQNPARHALWGAARGSAIKRYCHIGTGNYQSEDRALARGHGLVHCRTGRGRRPDGPVQHADRVFAQTEYPQPARGPGRIRSGIVDRINIEIERRRAGDERARVQLKANALVDEQIIDALYRASQAGSPVEVMVRGICALATRDARNQRELSPSDRFSVSSGAFAHFTSPVPGRVLDRICRRCLQSRPRHIRRWYMCGAHSVATIRDMLFRSAGRPTNPLLGTLHSDGSWVASPAAGGKFSITSCR